jgi:hypothetical protein
MISYIGDMLCIPLDPAAIYQITSALQVLNATDAVVCEPENAPPTPDQLVALNMNRDDMIDDALAGYDAASPLVADATRHATLAMNSMALLEIIQSDDDLELDAFNKVVLLFRVVVSKDIQCSSGIPPMDELLRFVINTNKTCTANQSEAVASKLVQGSFPSVDVADVTTAIERFITIVVKQSVVAMNPDATKSSATGDASESPKDEVGDITGTPDDAMKILPSSDCNDQDSTEMSANAAQPEDQARAAGQRDSTVMLNTDKAELPLFGRQVLNWGTKNPSVVVLSQPSELDMTL